MTAWLSHEKPFSPQRFPFFYGWIILACGCLGMVMSVPGQTIGVSVFIDPLLEALQLSRSQLSTTYMIGTVISAFCLPIAGRIYDRFGARMMVGGVTIALAITLLAMSAIDRATLGLATVLGLGIQIPIACTLATLGFTAMRFFGQGAMVMVARNMTMKWFKRRRGFASGVIGVVMSLGFSSSAILFNALVDRFSWATTWQLIAAFLLVVFTPFAILFFRDNPHDHGLLPDGMSADSEEENEQAIGQSITLAEARRTYLFWAFNLGVCLPALLNTAVTFHVVSIFQEAGYDRELAISMFLPSAIISTCLGFLVSWLSDYTKLKYVLMVSAAGLMITSWAVVQLSAEYGVPLLIGGFALTSGMFGILSTVSWPRFFGIQHLGAITGFTMSWAVFFSAVGPAIFGYAKDFLGGYAPAAYFCLVISLLQLVAAAFVREERPA